MVKRKFSALGHGRNRSLLDHLRAPRRQVWIEKSFRRGALVKTVSALNTSVQHWFSDIAMSIHHRVQDGGGVGRLSCENIEIVDGFARLPPAPKLRSDQLDPVEEFYHLCCNGFGSEESEDKLHLLRLLESLISDTDPMASFQFIPLHFFLRSSHANLLFVRDSVTFLRDNKDEVEVLLGGPWRVVYADFSTRNYNIGQSIRGNPYLVQVYNHRMYDEEAGQPVRRVYDNTSVGVLFYMVNVIKHINDYRIRAGKAAYTDTEVELLLEHTFPGEMRLLFDFFWDNKLGIDWANTLRPD